MTNPDLQPGKPVQTRSGLEAVIYAVHEGQEYPIHGAYKSKDGEWVPFTWRDDGSVWEGGFTYPHDIIPIPKKLAGFINVYAFSVHETREEADMAACDDRIACLDLKAPTLLAELIEQVERLQKVADAARGLCVNAEQCSRNTSYVYTDKLDALRQALEESK